MIYFETQRLILRNVHPGDVPIMYDYRNNEICAKFQRGQVKTLPEITALVEKRSCDALSADSPAMVAVALKETNEMIGEIVVMPNNPTLSLGYTFSYKHHRKGYAFEALSFLIEYLHAQLPGWEFICLTEPENSPSIALLKKLGYEDLGYAEKITSQVFGKWAIPE